MKYGFAAAVVAAGLLAGCASPKVVKETQLGDESLSCGELKAQIAEAASFEQKARDERGVTGTNVAAAVLFWPALIATYSNTEDAIKAAERRQEHLKGIYRSKGCQ